MSLNTLLISDTMITERTAMHGNIDPKLIYPDIKVAQDMYIMPLLGTALYDKLQTLISENTIGETINEPYKTLLDKYIADALIYYTLSSLPMTMGYQFWNKGVVRKQGTETETPTMLELYDLGSKYKNIAEFYAQRMKRYIRAYANEKFPEYLNPGSTSDTVNPDNRPFTMPIYLGDDSDCCNPGGFNGQPYQG